MSVAVEQDAAFARLLEARQHAQQRGLAAARGAEQREEFAFVDVERQPLDGDNAAEALAHRLEPHQRPGGRIVGIALHHAGHAKRAGPGGSTSQFQLRRVSAFSDPAVGGVQIVEHHQPARQGTVVAVELHGRARFAEDRDDAVEQRLVDTGLSRYSWAPMRAASTTRQRSP